MGRPAIVKNPFENFSSEHRLMLACAGSNTIKVQNMLQQPVDWDMFVKLALHHRVHPLVYKMLNYLNDQLVPQIVLDRLKQKYQSNVLQSLDLAWETIRLVKCLDSHGIRAIVLKGVPMALFLYGDIASRPSRDIDILVMPHQIPKVQEILENEGYCGILPGYKMNLRQFQIFLGSKHVRHLGYLHSEKNIFLELHWKLGCELTMPAENDVTIINVSGNPIPVLSDEKCLLFLILHGAGHAWFRLRWLVDIAKFIQIRRIDWDRVAATVDKSQFKSFFYQGLIVANRLLEVPVPPVFQSVLKNNQEAWRLACLAMEVCLAKENYEIWGSNGQKADYIQKIYDAKLRVGWKNKLSYSLRYFRPHPNDIKFVELNDLLYPLYYIIKPFTYIGRRVRKLSR